MLTFAVAHSAIVSLTIFLILSQYRVILPSVFKPSIKRCLFLYKFPRKNILFIMFIDRPMTENDIYAKLLSNKLPANLGYLYEVDFLVSEGCKINA